jgi:hypothetical protein
MRLLLVVGGWIHEGNTVRPWKDRYMAEDRNEVACVMADHVGKFMKTVKLAGKRRTDKAGEIWFEVWLVDEKGDHLEVAEGEFGW